MSKTLTDRELRAQLQTLDHGQLKNYLFQVVRQLEKYQVEKLTEEERFFLEKLIKEIKAELLLPLGPFRLDLEFFNRKEEELYNKLKKVEKERTLAAEIGQTLLKKNEELTQAISILTEQKNSLSSELQTEISNKEAAAQLGLELILKNEELTSQVNTLAGQLRKVNINEINQLNNTIVNYEKQKANWENEQKKLRQQISKDKSEIKKVKSINALLEQRIGTAGTENEQLRESNEKLTKKIAGQQAEIKDNNKILKNDEKIINELTDDLAKEKQLRTRDNKTWQKKEDEGAKLVKEGINKFRELEQQCDKLKQDNDELLSHALSLKDRIEELKSENGGLERQIEHNEQKNNGLNQKEISTSQGEGLSLEEEINKADKLEKTEQKVAKLEQQLTEKEEQIIELKNQTINKQEHLESEAQKNSQEETIQKLIAENENHKNEIARLKIQLRSQTASPSVISKLEQEKKKLIRQLEFERTERQKIEQENEQSELAGVDNAKKVEILQQEITENINFINSLHENTRQSETEWQGKVSSINDDLHRTQERLTSLIREQERTRQELETRTQERDEARQEEQKLKDNLKIGQLKESELNEQIAQFQGEIVAVQKKLNEVERDRNDKHHTILNHHQEEMDKLEKEKEELLKKHQELTTLYEKANQQLKELNDKLKKSQSLSDAFETNFIDAYEKLKAEKDKNYELEQKLKEQVDAFAAQISNLKKLSAEEKQQLIQKITSLNNEKLINEQQLAKKIAELKVRIKDLESTSRTEKENLENALTKLENNLQAKIITEAAYQNQIQELGLEINNLEQKIQNLTSISEQVKQQLIKELTTAKEKLNERNDIIKDLENKKEELDNRISSLVANINSLQQTSQEEKNVLNQQLESLKNAKLTSESKLQEKINNLNTYINSLSDESKKDKEILTRQLLLLQTKLAETITERKEREISIQRLTETINDLQGEIKTLKKASQEEKNNLLQQLSELQSAQKIGEGAFEQQINNLKQQIENLTEASQEEKNNLNNKISDLELKITVVTAAESNYKKTIVELEKELKNTTDNLVATTNFLRETEEERDKFLDKIRDLEQSNLTAKQLSQREVKRLQKLINDLLKISAFEKEKIKKQVFSLKIELETKVQAEAGYQTKIRELEDNLANTTKALTNKLKIATQIQIKERSQTEKLKEEVKVKEQTLKELHEKLITLQKQLNTANDTINQQNQKISEKNQQLTDLSNQLTDKDKLIADLQTEITNLKKPPTFTVNINTDNTKKDELSKQTREENKMVKEKSNIDNKSTTSYSQEDLEKLIKEHQQEVQNLKILIAGKPQETAMVQEVTTKEAIQQLPKKNTSSLWLCLLGYSLSAIVLCLNLLKKSRTKNKQ